MSDEIPIDLRGLAVDEPEVMRASIRRFRRRVVILVAWMMVFAAAAFAIAADAIQVRNQNPEALIATNPSENSALGNYQVGPIDVGLVKVVNLPNDQIGMQFVLHSTGPLGLCCNIYPHLATSSNRIVSGDSRFGEVLVVIERSYVTRTGPLDLLLTSGDPHAPASSGRFTVDLRALHVAGIGG